MSTSDTVSIIISLFSVAFSVAVSLFLGVTALKVSNKSNTALAIIQTELNVLRSDFMRQFAQVQMDYHEVIKIMIAEKVHRGEWSNEQAYEFQEELNQTLQETREHNFNPASVLSTLNKVGEKEQHG